MRSEGLWLGSEKLRKYGCADYGEDSGNSNRKAAHGALYLAHLHGFCSSHGVRGGADGDALGDWLGDVGRSMW